MKSYLYRVITGEIVGFRPTVLLALLIPLSWMYRIIVELRGWLYDLRLLKPKRLPRPVISVGNIVAGGTGKTPAVIWMAKALRQEGVSVAILLRGYGRQSEQSAGIVSDGKETFMSVEASGDEAAMITSELCRDNTLALAHCGKNKLASTFVLIGKDRYAAGIQAIRSGNVGALILDDGFQHRKLARNLEIVTIDATQPFGTGKLLPAGTLREPASALGRADLILITRIDLIESPFQIRKTVEKLAPGTPIVESCHQPTELYRLGTNEKFEFHLLKGKRLLAVCGIGNPKAFADTLRRCQPKCVKLLAFPDHHRYTQKDMCQIQDCANQTQADLIVTTCKDEQKLRFISEGMQMLVLAVELVITNGRDVLDQRLRECVSATAEQMG